MESLTYNFIVHSNEITCKKMGRIGLDPILCALVCTFLVKYHQFILCLTHIYHQEIYLVKLVKLDHCATHVLKIESSASFYLKLSHWLWRKSSLIYLDMDLHEGTSVSSNVIDWKDFQKIIIITSLSTNLKVNSSNV